MTLDDALAMLQRRGTKATRDGLARYGIHAPKAFGVTVADVRRIAKEIGTDHRLALALWDSGWYEARLLACFIAEPKIMTAEEMNRWSRDFDSWALVDTACLHLFDRTRHAWRKVEQWSRHDAELVRRAGFALLAALALHDRSASEAPYRRQLRLIEELASDERHYVKKGVSWALRAIGTRSAALHDDALAVAHRLAASAHRTERWIGRDAVRKLTAAATQRRIARRSQRAR